MSLKIEFSILGIQIQIETNDEVLGYRLRDLQIKAHDPFPIFSTVVIEAQKRGEVFSVFENGAMIMSYADRERATLYIHELINFRVAGKLKDFIKIHAAFGSFKGKRFLLVGDKGAGKTTLITRLLFEGADAYGDETILLQGADFMPIPRKFHLKEGSLHWVPQLIPICEKLSAYPAYQGGRFFFFDPTDAGFDWEVKKGNVDAIFYLEPRHGRTSEVEASPSWLMAQKMLMQSSDFAANPEVQIGHLCSVVETSDTFIMHIGTLNEAVSLVRDILG